jgi:hypothetical protein
LSRNERSAEEGKLSSSSVESVGSNSRERERVEELLEEKLKPLEEKKQIRRNSIHINILHSQLHVEIVQRKKEPRRHSLFIQRVSNLLQDESGPGVEEVIRNSEAPSMSSSSHSRTMDKLDEIRQMKQTIRSDLRPSPGGIIPGASTGTVLFDWRLILSTAGDLHSTRVRHRTEQRLVEVDMIDKALPK